MSPGQLACDCKAEIYPRGHRCLPLSLCLFALFIYLFIYGYQEISTIYPRIKGCIQRLPIFAEGMRKSMRKKQEGASTEHPPSLSRAPQASGCPPQWQPSPAHYPEGIRSPCIPHSYGPLSLGPRMPSPSRLEDGLLPQHSRRKSDVNPQMKKAEQVGLC